MTTARAALETADWRRLTFELYDIARLAAESDGPADAHAIWKLGRDRMLATHPASAILPDERAGFRGVPVAPYDPAWRFEVPITPVDEPRKWDVETGTDGVVPFELLGRAVIPGIGSLDVWRLSSYGGGRYLIDTVKGAWLGGDAESIVLDFNFAYNPSCAYDPAWACPLALPSNTLPVDVPVGERMP